MVKNRLKAVTDVAEDQVKAGVKRLQDQLVTVEKAAGRLTARAKERLPSGAGLKPELPVVRDRLERAKASVMRRQGRDRASGGSTAAPDDSWTVAELREEARTRGLTGYSRMKKAELLAALRG